MTVRFDRDALFARTNEFRIMEDFEWVKPLLLDLEPGSVGVFERKDGQKIIVRHEDDPRDRDEEREEEHTVDEKLPEFMFTVVTRVGTFKRVSSQSLAFAVVYVPEDRRRAGQDGFCHGWTVNLERARVLAAEIRERFNVGPIIAPVMRLRPWCPRTSPSPEE